MIKKIIKLLSITFTTASRAYWIACRAQHCGGDFDEENCNECRHCSHCQKTEEFWKLLAELSDDLVDINKEIEVVRKKQR